MFGIFLTNALGLINNGDSLVIAMFFSLLPDIDHRKSLLGRFNLLNYVGVMKHRGFCHTVLFVFICSLPFLKGHSFLVAFVAGISHLLADRFYSLFSGSGWKIKFY